MPITELYHRKEEFVFVPFRGASCHLKFDFPFTV